MKCPDCENEMERGRASFLSMQGMAQMMLSFTSDVEAKKGFFKRKTKDAMILSGEATEAYYCPCCNRIMLAFTVK